MVQDGAIDTLRKIYVEYPQGWLSQEQELSNKQAAWRTDPTLSGASGCMGDIRTHAFALTEFILGQKITSLCADLNTHVVGIVSIVLNLILPGRKLGSVAKI